jgi:ABC-2 type transport system permease protein
MNWGELVMISKTSLFKKGLILSDFKRFWWVSALYALCLFFLLPFNILMQGLRWENIQDTGFLARNLNIFSTGEAYQVFFICIIPAAAAVLVFRYMQVEKSSSMMHSLPCRRSTLYSSHSAAGAALLAAPVIFTGFLLILLQSMTFLGEYFSLVDVSKWTCLTLLLNMLFFFCAVFVGMFTGSSIAQIVFTYALHLLPSALYLLVDFNLERLLFGYPGNRISESFFNNFPLIFLVNNGLNTERFSPGHIAGYIIALALLIAAGAYAYRHRKMESAGDVISFSGVKPVFKYGVAVCCALLGGVYFANVSNGSLPVIVTGYVFSSFLGYWISEMLIHKSYKVWRAYKGYLVYTAVMLAVLACVLTDVTGYVKRVPKPDQVERVYFGYNLHDWLHIEKLKDVDDYNRIMLLKGSYSVYDDTGFFETEDNIQNIINLHKMLIQQPEYDSGISRYIIYTLKNGKFLMRRYSVDEEHHAAFLKPVYESMEYKKSRFPLIEQRDDEIKLIEIRDDRSSKKGVILVEKSELQEFASLFRQELINADYKELTSRQRNYISVNIRENEYNSEDLEYYKRPYPLNYSLGASYDSVLNWLKEKGYYEEIFLLPEEVEYVHLFKNEFSGGVEKAAVPGQEKGIIIEDVSLIKEMLDINEDYKPRSRTEDMIWMRFYLKDHQGYPQFEAHFYTDTPISPDLKAYIDRLD